MDYIFVIVTAGSEEEGERIGTNVVKEGLAACCNIIPNIKSIFKWKGEICAEKEVILFIKSKASLFDKLKNRIKELHSYEVPEIIAFPISQGLPDYFKWMDEGIKARRVDIIKNGRFVNFLTSRETTKSLGGKSNGSVRASSWSDIPIIRMSNINLEPQEGSLNDLIADTKDGILLETNKSWSIDTLRLNFQFGMEIGWKIKRGKITRPLKNPVYSGITPDFWKRCNAICGKEEWWMYGLNSCGKGDPVQSISVGHGAVPARFRKVKVGTSKC